MTPEEIQAIIDGVAGKFDSQINGLKEEIAGLKAVKEEPVVDELPSQEEVDAFMKQFNINPDTEEKYASKSDLTKIAKQLSEHSSSESLSFASAALDESRKGYERRREIEKNLDKIGETLKHLPREERTKIINRAQELMSSSAGTINLRDISTRAVVGSIDDPRKVREIIGGEHFHPLVAGFGNEDNPSTYVTVEDENLAKAFGIPPEKLVEQKLAMEEERKINKEANY